jgi:hypothetical protein
MRNDKGGRTLVGACNKECLSLLSPDKLRDPLGWPFGKLDPEVLERLSQEQEEQRLLLHRSAPFEWKRHDRNC